MDDPDDPTKSKPFCMVCYRMKVAGTWTRFRGKASNPSKAAIYTRYTSNGRGISGVTELYALGLDDGSAPARSAYNSYPNGGIPQFDPEHGYTRLWNIEIITYDDDSEPTETPAACIAVWVEGKGIGSIREFYYRSEYNTNTAAQPAYPSKTPAGEGWSRVPLTVNKEKPYLWNYEVVIDTNGNVLNITEPVIIAYYTYTDVEYLTELFGKGSVDDANGAILRSFVGVKDANSETNVVAFMNGGDIGKDTTHGKLMFASGIPTNPGLTLDDNSKEALTRIYEDGHIVTKSAKIEDSDLTNVNVKGYIEQNFQKVPNVNWRSFVKANYICLGWEGLSFNDRGKQVSYPNPEGAWSFPLNYLDLPNGKVTVANMFYVADSGDVYYNEYKKPTTLSGAFFFPKGDLECSISTVTLNGGWIEFIKLVVVDESNNPIEVTSQYFKNIYLITGYGGTVTFDYTGVHPKTNSNGVITSTTTTPQYRSEYTMLQATFTNAFVLSTAISTVSLPGQSDPLYVVLPTGKWNTSPIDLLEFVIYLPKRHGEIIFKEALYGTVIAPDNIANLDNASFINGNPTGSGLLADNYSVISAGRYELRVTYVGKYSVLGRWAITATELPEL